MGAPACACLAFEDEEAQILTRWTVCAIMFGWVTMLPVLLVQPHEERPRQQLFRQYLLKPCLLVMPLWILMWLLDCLQMIFEHQIVHPFFYFGLCHMALPAVLVWYLLQMQLADEKLVLDQRRARAAEALYSVPVVVEDPAPTLLRELITINPVALVWLGTCASIPLVTASLLTPMTTRRAKLAQGYVHVVYGPLMLLQVTFAYILFHVRFVDLPKLYLAGFGVLFPVPCFLVWCFCLVCVSRYGREDVALVERQRLERAAELLQQLALARSPSGASAAASCGEGLVDCTEAHQREWELIYTA